MRDLHDAIAVQTQRQVAHWTQAAARLDLDDLASHDAWGRLESYLGVSIRRHLQTVLDRLASEARVLIAVSREARSPTAQREVRSRLLAFRGQYLRAETTQDFFADAIGSAMSKKCLDRPWAGRPARSAISRILIQIESGDYDFAEAVPALYTPAPGGNTPEAAMRAIITHWTAITGRDVKARKVTPS